MTVFSIFTLQKFTNFHAIRSWSFQNICNEVGWPRFCATPCKCNKKAEAAETRFLSGLQLWRYRHTSVSEKSYGDLIMQNVTKSENRQRVWRDWQCMWSVCVCIVCWHSPSWQHFYACRQLISLWLQLYRDVTTWPPSPTRHCLSGIY